MLVANEREQLVLYETSVSTEHGRLEIWVDGLLTWKAGVRAHQSLDGREQLDGQARGWLDGIKDLLTIKQRDEAFEILDRYVADVFREINEVFSDSTDPMCDAWKQSATLLRHLYKGLAEYYLVEGDLFLEGSLDAMPAFAHPQEIALCGGLRVFELTTREVDGEQIIWALKRDPDETISGTRDQLDLAADHVSLVDVVDYAAGPETRQVFELHVAAMGQAADHLRFVLNKLRAGVKITLPELVRLRSFAGTILNFREQFRQAT